MSGSGAKSQHTRSRETNLITKTLLSPAKNDMKSVRSISSAEDVFQSFKWSEERTKRPSTSITHDSNKPEGWSKFVSNTSFIETLFTKIGKDVKNVDAKRPTTGKKTKKDAQNTIVIQGDSKNQILSADDKMITSAAKKLVVPWRKEGSFASPSALQKRTFENFYKMSPDPPKTPVRVAKKPTAVRDVQNSSGVGPKKQTGVSGTLTVSGIRHVLNATRMEMDGNKSKSSTEPSNVQLRSLHLPVTKSSLTPRDRLYSGLLENQISNCTTKDSSVRVQSILTSAKSKDRYAKASRVLFGDKEQLPPPMPLSKRRDLLPRNQPPIPQKLNYRAARGTLSWRTNNQAERNQIKSKFSAKPDAADKTKTNQIAEDVDVKRRLRPSMLFPLHVPGSEQQEHDFFIGDYHSDSSDTEIAKTRGEESLHN